MPTCKLSITWPTPATGTGPFKTGFDFTVPGGSSDQEDVVDAVEAWWEAQTNFRAIFSSGLGIGTVSSVGEFGGVVVEYTGPALSAPTGSTPDLPGVSLRLIKVASRPAGGRRGSMFWPQPNSGVIDAEGFVAAGTVTIANTAGAALITAVEGAVTGAELVQVHNVAGTPTETLVTSFSCASTASYLNRRYR